MTDQRGQTTSGFRTSDVKGLLDSLTEREDTAKKAHPPGSEIGKYLVQRLLGCQGQATLLLAIDPDLRRQVVLKLYHSGVSGQQRARLVNEGRALARLSHENVASCHGIEELNKHLYLVLEFVEGKSLREILDKSSLKHREMATIFRQIAVGLHHVHQAGLLHGDLKPSNVMIKDDGTVKLIDFGLVQTTISDATDGSGTPAYMAPERVNDPPVIDERSDIFSAGAMLYEMLTGEPPFAAATNQGCRELARLGKIEPVQKRNPTAPDQLAAICSTCVATDSAMRYESAQGLIEAIDANGVGNAPVASTKVQLSAAGKVAMCAMILGLLGAGLFVWHTIFVGSTDDFAAVEPTASKAPVIQHPKVPNEMYVGMDQLRKLPKSVIKALSEDNADAALATTKEGVELASRPELAEGYLNEYGKLDEEVQRWAEASPAVRAAICSSFVELYNALGQRGSLTEKSSVEELKERCRNAVREIARVTGSEDSLILNYAKEMLASIERDDPRVIDLWQEIVKSGSDMFGIHSPYCLDVKYRLAYAAVSHGRYDIAKEKFGEIAATETDTSAPSRRLAFQALMAQSSSLVSLERLDQARNSVEAAGDLLDSIRPDKPGQAFMMEELHLLAGSIRIERKSNDDFTAIKLGKQAQTLMNQMEDDVEKRGLEAMICSQLGCSYARTGQRKKAEEVISRGLEIERKESGESSSRYANQLSMASLAWSRLDEERAYEYCLSSHEINEQSRGMNANSASGLINLARLSTADNSRMRTHTCEAFRVLQKLRDEKGIGDKQFVYFLLENAKFLNKVNATDLFEKSVEIASNVIESSLEQASGKNEVEEWERLLDRLRAVKALKHNLIYDTNSVPPN